jgi:penicillin-binding protein 1A
MRKPAPLAPSAERPTGIRVGRILLWLLLGGLGLVAVGAATVTTMFWIYGSDPNLPRLANLRDYKPKQKSQILASDGKLIGELYVERRSFVAIEQIAPIMVNAVIDAEDSDFRSHEGISIIGMARAFWVNLRSGRARQGGSTITQQVVKTFVLSPEKTIKRKIQELILARRLEQTLSKDEILTLYLNQIYFGAGRYGVEEASRFFFGKPAKELGAGEAALLAGLPQSPERLSPIKHPDAAKARQTYVLEQLVRRGHLPAAEAQKWIDRPIEIVRSPEPWLDIAPEFVDAVKRELEKRYGTEEAATLGLTVKTTLDVPMQKAARAALEKGLRELDGRQGYRGPIERLKPDKAIERLKALQKKLPPGGPHIGETFEAVVTEVGDADKTLRVDVGGWKGAVLLEGAGDERANPDKKKPSERFQAGDVVRVRLDPTLPKPAKGDGAVTLELGPQAAMVVIEPQTRNVLAMIGGYGYELGGFNRALRAKRQPGSAFKPILYAAALDGGQYTPATIVNDAPEVYDLWKPKNYERGTFLGPVRLRYALAKSINTVAIRVIHEVTPPRVVEMAHALGIDEDLPAELSLALGSGVVTPIEFANAIATFPAEGRYAPPVVIQSIDGKPEPAVEPKQVLRPEIAFLIASMMRSVVEEGTATPVKKLGREIAGKTGTSNSAKDAWFIGFTPDLLAGIWVGFDDMRPLGKGEAGGKAAVPIFVDFMKTALKGRPPRTFTPPPGVVTVRIDKRTGLLAAPGEAESETMDEVFLEGTAPTETAPAPGEVDPSTFMIEQMDDEQGAANARPEQ